MITEPQKQAVGHAIAVVAAAVNTAIRLSNIPITCGEFRIVVVEVLTAWIGTGQLSEKAAQILATAMDDIFRTVEAAKSQKMLLDAHLERVSDD